MDIIIAAYYYLLLAAVSLFYVGVQWSATARRGAQLLMRLFFAYYAGALALLFAWGAAHGAYTSLSSDVAGALISFPYLYIFGFVTTTSFVFVFAYRTAENLAFLAYLALIAGAGLLLLQTDSAPIFFIAYELLLIPSFIILYKFAKTRRCVEAAYLMFFWTQLGALALLFFFMYMFLLTNTAAFSQWSNFSYTVWDSRIAFWLLLFGFGVKFPIWPFYGWLPRAHVEASTNFSIFLSGVLVKFAFFGFFKLLLAVGCDAPSLLAYPLLSFGLVDAAFKIFYQTDLKKIVAYATVIEMHWLTLAIMSAKALFFWAGVAMLTAHAILSTNSFLLVDALTRRFKTRLLTELSGVCWLTPKLFLVTLANLLIFLGIPGTLFFIAEVLFFYALFELHMALACFFIFFLYFLVPTFFFRSFSNALFGALPSSHAPAPADLTRFELLLFSAHVLLLVYLGVTWQYVTY